MKKNRISMTAAIVIAAIVVLVTANLILGFILLQQSNHAMRQLIQARMLDISNSAAAMLDGDAMKELTKEDADSPAYRQAMDSLSLFQENIELEYIYAIAPAGEKQFVFSVDPTIEDPGEFGSPVQYTDALYKASLGQAAVDQEAYTDAWGRFYSAYSPVFDSQGSVAVIVAVDFSADWYETEIRRNILTIMLFCILSLTLGAAIAMMITGRIRKRFHELYAELSDLSDDVDDLTRDMHAKGTPSPELYDDVTDENQRALMEMLASGEASREQFTPDISDIGQKVTSIRSKLHAYLAYVHEQAYMDAMTGVGNKTAYLICVKQQNKKISEKSADFSIIVFDINGLKTINDVYGHESGDRIIVDAARLLMQIFDVDHVYRIGGDEFIAVLEHVTPEEIDEDFGRLAEALERFNREEKTYEMVLAISKGASQFIPDADDTYKAVFKRADEAMYEDKASYYAQNEAYRRK